MTRTIFIFLIGFVTTAFSAQAQNFEFDNSEFDIISNYIFLQLGRKPSAKAETLRLTDEKLAVDFDYTSNAEGFRAIYISDRKKQHYTVNNEFRPNSTFEMVTVLCSPNGTQTDEPSYKHFKVLVSRIKEQLIAAMDFENFHQFLQNNIQVLSRDYNIDCSFLTEGSQKSVVISSSKKPKPFFIPFSISSVTYRGKSSVRWKYMKAEKITYPDGYFFKVFTNLLLQSKTTGITTTSLTR